MTCTRRYRHRRTRHGIDQQCSASCKLCMKRRQSRRGMNQGHRLCTWKRRFRRGTCLPRNQCSCACHRHFCSGRRCNRDNCRCYRCRIPCAPGLMGRCSRTDRTTKPGPRSGTGRWRNLCMRASQRPSHKCLGGTRCSHADRWWLYSVLRCSARKLPR